MSIERVKTAFIELTHCIRMHEKIAKLTGEEFNIFKILELETSETRSHSAFIKELLDSKGSHGLGSLFLELFIKEFDVGEFDSNNSHAETEKNIGPLSEDKKLGGRIDILVEDKNKRHIVIENKIHADDQPRQMLRYYNFDKESALFYLTLKGDEPTPKSTNGELGQENYKAISYRYDILKWLESCRKEAVNVPIVRENIGQYIQLIKRLTNQSTTTIMKEDIKELLLKNPEYINAIKHGNEVLNSILYDAKACFEIEMEKQFIPLSKELKGGLILKGTQGEDGDGVYFGYQLSKGKDNKSNTDTGKQLFKTIKAIDNRIYNGGWSFVWFNPTPFTRYKKFESLETEMIIKLVKDRSEMAEFVRQLIEQEQQIRKELLTAVENMNLTN